MRISVESLKRHLLIPEMQVFKGELSFNDPSCFHSRMQNILFIRDIARCCYSVQIIKVANKKNSIYSFNFVLEDTRIQYKWIFRFESIKLIKLQTDAFQTLLLRITGAQWRGCCRALGVLASWVDAALALFYKAETMDSLASEQAFEKRALLTGLRSPLCQKCFLVMMVTRLDSKCCSLYLGSCNFKRVTCFSIVVCWFCVVSPGSSSLGIGIVFIMFHNFIQLGQ